MQPSLPDVIVDVSQRGSHFRKLYIAKYYANFTRVTISIANGRNDRPLKRSVEWGQLYPGSEESSNVREVDNAGTTASLCYVCAVMRSNQNLCRASIGAVDRRELQCDCTKKQ